MPQKIRIWEVTENNTLTELPSTEISLEERLEDWLESDISVLGPNLLVIGRQVRTDFGGEIDLLCLDKSGDIVVIELKKGQTPREVTAQALDYASWIENLSVDRILSIADGYYNSDDSLGEVFSSKFAVDLPDNININHRSLIVAESMDASTERIVRYLSAMNVPINVATVQHFKTTDGREILAQVYLIEPEIAEAKAQPSSRNRRHPYTTVSQMETIAGERGVADLYNRLNSRTSSIMRTSSFRKESRGYQIQVGGSWLAVLVIDLDESGGNNGIRFRLNGTRLMNHFELSADQLDNIMPEQATTMAPSELRNVTPDEAANWTGFKGFFRTMQEIDRFVDGLWADRT